MISKPRLAAAGLGLAGLLAACSSSSSGGTSSASSGAGGYTTEDAAYVSKQVDAYMGTPTWTAPGPAFDATKANGKSVFAIPTASQIPFVQAFNDGQKQAGALAKLKYTDCPNNGSLSEWSKCFGVGLGQNPGVLMLSAPDPAELKPQIAQANAQHTPVMSLGLYDPAIPKVSGVAAWTFEPYAAAGRLEADYIIKESRGNAHILIVTSNDLTTSHYITDAISDEFAKYCGSGCTSNTINVVLADWGSKMQSATQSALVADPNYNWILPIYDGMTQFVVPAVAATNRTGKAKIVTFNGTPFALKYVQTGQIAMDVGQDLNCIGYSNMDPVLRQLSGVPPVDNTNNALRIWTSDNVAEAGTPPTVDKGYGTACLDGFTKLWGLG